MTKKDIGYILLTFFGFFDSVYLTIAHYKDLTVPCQIAHGCDTVLTSKYAEVMGIPIAVFGAMFYLTILFLWLLGRHVASERIKQLSKLLIIIATIISAFLVYLQAFVLRAFCQYCLLSELITTLLFVIVLLPQKKPHTNVSS